MNSAIITLKALIAVGCITLPSASNHTLTLSEYVTQGSTLGQLYWNSDHCADATCKIDKAKRDLERAKQQLKDEQEKQAKKDKCEALGDKLTRELK